MAKREVTGLSKNLLQMKFMQRTKEKAENERIEKENSKKLVGQDLLDLCKSEGDRFMTTKSYLLCENLRYGRMSFKGMNPEIEQLMEAKKPKQIADEDDANKDDDTTEAEVSNNDMAKAFKRLRTNHRHSRA